MKKVITFSVFGLLSLIFAIIEAKSSSIHFPSLVTLIGAWFPCFLFLPLMIFDRKKLKQLRGLKLVGPVILSLGSLLMLTITIRNQISYISSFESIILAYSNRLMMVLVIGYLKFRLIEHFEAWGKILELKTSLLGRYQFPQWLNKLIFLPRTMWRNKKQTLSALAVYTLLFAAADFLVYYKPRTKVLKDASQKSSETIKTKIKTIQAYFYAPSVPFFELKNKKIVDTINPFNLNFNENPYDLDQDKNLDELFDVFPETEGKWEKTSETQYQFTPSNHWQTDTEYTIRIKLTHIRDNIELSTDEMKFKTDPVRVYIDSSKFYVNPKDSNEKKVVIALSSNYPLDEDSVRAMSQFELRTREGRIVKKLKAKIFSDEIKKKFYLHSQNIGLKSSLQNVKYILKEGVRSRFASKPTAKEKTKKISIPSKFSFLTIDLGGIRTQTDEDDQFYHSIKIEANTRIREDAIAKHFGLTKIKLHYTSAEYKKLIDHYGKEAEKCFSTYQKKGFLTFRTDCELRENALWTFHDSMILEKNVPYQFKTSKFIDETRHELIVEPDVGSTYMVKLKKGLLTVDGYELEFDKIEFSEAPPFPRELRFANKGSILSLNGKRKISIYGRGETKATVTVKQIKAFQIQHFLSLSSADKTSPYFDYGFDYDRITDEYRDSVVFDGDNKKGQYTEFDFSRYLNRRTGGKLNYGIFYVTLTDSRGEKKASQIFILSDMAYLIKRDVQYRETLFVASQSEQEPLADVVVKEMAVNGETKTIGRTDSRGQLKLPKEYQGKSAIGYILEKGNDLLYIAERAKDQRVDFSRFPVAGEYSFEKKLRVSIFSDRKLYRPGESGHLAFIFKDSDWTKKYEGELFNIEIRDSRGKVFLTQDQKIKPFGVNSLSFNLSYAAPTGEYNITISSYHTEQNLRGERTLKRRMGGHTIKVQEFLPDKMKITASFNKGGEKLWVKPTNLSANVSLRNLFGTPAVGNEIRSTLILNPRSINVFKFPSYKFFDEKILKYSVNEELKALDTNEEGRAEYDLDLDKYKDNTFRLTFHGEGFMKTGGRSVVTEKSVVVSPHDFLIGYKPKGNLNYISVDKDVEVNLIAVGSNHKTKEAKIEVITYEKKYQNALVKQADHTYAYQDIKEPIVYKQEMVSVPLKGLDYVLDNSKVGEFIVKIKNEQGVVLNSFDYNVVGEGDLARSLYRSNELKLKLNKDDFKAGEEIKISIKAPYTGFGLVTIEKEKVYASKWIKLSRETSEVSINVPKSLQGNGYVNVSLLRSLDSRKIFTSPFSYAVVPFTLDKSKMVHDIEIKSENLVKPGDDIKVQYKAKTAGKIIIYAVDKGIHQLAKYKTPSPLSEFYKKQALRVDTFQIFSLILPDIEAVKSAFAAGGGDGDLFGRNLNPFKRKFTKAVAFWSDILDADTDWREYRFQVPYHFNGELVLHAVYVDRESVGVKKSSILSRDDLIITPTLPTFAAPGDEFVVSAAISNNIDEGEIKLDEVKVGIEASEAFEVVGKKQQKVKIKRSQDEVVTFKLKAKKKLGNATVAIEADAGKYSSYYEDTMSVRPMYPKVNRNWQYLVTDGDYEVKLDDIKFHQEFFNLELDLFEGVFALLKGNLRYLASYPYGCSEQIVSKAVPYAVLPDAVLNKSAKERKNFLRRTNNLLLQRQADSGGIALYNGNPVGSDYLNLYIYQFLTVSKEKGYYVNKRLFDRLSQYVSKLSQNGDTRTKAFALYLMARNEVQVGASAKLLDQKKPEDIYAQMYLAGIFDILKNDKKALYYIEQVEKNRGKYDFEYSYGYYKSSFERAYLGILYRHFPDRASDVIADLVQEMVGTVKKMGASSMWAGQTLLSLSSLGEGNMINVELELDMGKKEKKILAKDFASLSQKERFKIKQIKMDLDEKTFGLLNLNISGFPQKIKPYKNGIQISKKLLDQEGNEIDQVKNGEEVTVELSIQGDSAIRNAVIVDLLPGGFDLVWQNEDKSKNTLSTDFVDQREDRIILYSRLETSVEKYYYKIKAVSPGSFQVPPAYAENMYKTVESVLSRKNEIKITK